MLFIEKRNNILSGPRIAENSFIQIQGVKMSRLIFPSFYYTVLHCVHITLYVYYIFHYINALMNNMILLDYLTEYESASQEVAWSCHLEMGYSR